MCVYARAHIGEERARFSGPGAVGACELGTELRSLQE